MTGPVLTPARTTALKLGLSDAQQVLLNKFLLTSAIAGPKQLAAFLIKTCYVSTQKALQTAVSIWQSQITEPLPTRGGLALLATLRSRGIRYGFISNICLPYSIAFSRLYGVLSVSELQFFSFRLHLIKPDPLIFQKAISATGLNPSCCIMVGDSYENDMQPAIMLGMKTVWCLHRSKKESLWLDKVRCRKLPAPDVVVLHVEQLVHEQQWLSSNAYRFPSWL